MNIKFQKTVQIKTIEDWYVYGHPKRDDQWANGRSAKLMAQYALSDKFKVDIENILGEFRFSKESELVCEPEYLTPLPPNEVRGDRHHDLLIAGNDFIIGVEAKVLETFGGSIGENLVDASPQKQDRIEKLLKIIGKNAIDDESKKIMYQLLTGLTGTMIEAANRKLHKCLFLIIVFTGDIVMQKGEENNAEKNDEAFKQFCDFVDFKSEGDKKYVESTIDYVNVRCYIKKIKVKVEVKKQDFKKLAE